MADLLQEWLTQAGCTTVVATDAGCLSAACTGALDAILVDICSPRRTAAASVARLRSAFPDTPVVVMSGHLLPHEGRGVHEVAREIGAAGLLAKPFTREALLRALDHALMRE